MDIRHMSRETVEVGPYLVSPPSCGPCDVRGVRLPDGCRLRILVIDEEPAELTHIVHLLRRDPRVAHVNGVSDLGTATKYFQRAAEAGQPPDAVFMDVRIRGIDGLDIARMLSRFVRPPVVVFVTADTRSAVEAFELCAADYVLKPLRPERLAQAVHRVLHEVVGWQWAMPDAIGNPAENGNPDAIGNAVSAPNAVGELDCVAADDHAGEVIPVESGGVTRFVPLAEVRRVQAQGDYARFHTGTGSFLVRTPMTNLEKRWCPERFVRIHRSHLAALRHIAKVFNDGLTVKVLVGKETLTVSRRYTSSVRQILSRHLDSSLTCGRTVGP